MIGEREWRFLESHKHAIMATIGKDGQPQLTAVLAAPKDGKLLVSITETRVKYRNLVRDPRTTLCILGDSIWSFLTVEGSVRLIHLPEALPLLREYYELASGGPHENWQEYDEAMERDRRVIAEVTIERAYSFNLP